MRNIIVLLNFDELLEAINQSHDSATEPDEMHYQMPFVVFRYYMNFSVTNHIVSKCVSLSYIIIISNCPLQQFVISDFIYILVYLNPDDPKGLMRL